MDEWMSGVPMELRERLFAVVDLTNEFCDEHLNHEYKEICRKIAVALCQEGSPVTKGKPAIWACGIVYSAGWVNFLTDPCQEPYMRSEDMRKDDIRQCTRDLLLVEWAREWLLEEEE